MVWCIRRLPRLRDVPLNAGGIALNIIALAGLAQMVASSHPEYQQILHPMRWILMAESCSVITLCLVRILFSCERINGRLRPSLVAEIRSRSVVSSYCALLVAMQFAGLHLFEYVQEFFGSNGFPQHPALYAWLEVNCGHVKEHESINAMDALLERTLRSVLSARPNMLILMLADHGSGCVVIT